MQNCEPLAWYGLVVLILTGSTILVPYLRGKRDLCSAWNFLLVGVAIFVGIGCFEAALTPMRFPSLEWFAPSKQEVNWWMAATTIFLVTLFAAHYFDPISKMVAARVFNKWPPIETKVLLFVLAICLPMALAAQIPPLLRIPLVGPVLVNVSHKAIIFSCLFSFLLWYRNRLNIALLALFVGIFLGMLFLSILVSGGRRMILSVCLGPALAFYFYTARNWRPTRALVVCSIGCLALLIISLIYSTIRHFDRVGGRKQRTAASAVEAIKRIDASSWFARFSNDALWSFSQQVVHYGLIVDRFCSSGRLKPKPLNTFHFIAVYPIPRRVYPSKPRSLGHYITFSVLGRSTTWGTGVAGQSRFEGGLIVAAMFAYMAAFGVRLFDDPLHRQPTNPFLIGMLAAAGMHLIAWPRGDLSVMTFDVAECFFFVWALSLLCRFFFGTETASHDSQLAAPSYRYAYHMSSP